ncbi:hypothetical protein [Moritella viscosa]|uniref:Putative orphan protein n=1 Tax=Moritella viscosa TaxID=80854 RepID=A0A1K9Z049_9GAMM|nr:hypothetical protein [Moritella viscosa]SGY89100.1 Putative orphan protein [Moritella viscosa]
MGKFTGEVSFFDRARNLIIDHQINLVKDELNDNRIYVDTVRFTEWMEDEVVQELSTLLLILEHNSELKSCNEPQLFNILEMCYFEFCSNKFFGIASYLGRRIRHGTFKGHLFSDVISIEANNTSLLKDPIIACKWKQWKSEHEDRIDSIVRDKLHIETTHKRSGFLNPNIRTNIKQDIANACMNDLLNDFKKNRKVHGSLHIIVEYCWRIAEVDLRGINTYFKSQKQLLMNSELISDIKVNANPCQKLLANNFARDLQRLINDKLATMYGWFKRPQSVAPKASLSLLYKAVVAEVNQTFRDFKPDTNFNEYDEIEIMGGAYHVLYDAFYVIVYNAAKHSKRGGLVSRSFKVVNNNERIAVEVTISSEIKDSQDDKMVNEKLQLSSIGDIDDAQLNEGRSGIIKLYHLEKYNEYFNINKVACENRQVTVNVSYELVHG